MSYAVPHSWGRLWWVLVRGPVLEELDEGFDRDAGFANQPAQRSLRKLAMVRNRQAPMGRLLAPQDDVATGLVVFFVAQLAECLDCRAARQDGKPAQARTSTSSSLMAGGIGSPCFARLAR